MKYSLCIIFLLSLFFASCSDKNDEPKFNEDNIIGYWAITHISTVEHVGGIHNTSDKDVSAHGNDSYSGDWGWDVEPRYDVLIFDEDFVTVRGDMPSCPKPIDYDETPDGQCKYISDFDSWCNSIACMTDQFACPVGTYSIKGNDLIIGSLNMGAIIFVSDNEFTLDYKKSLNDKGDYRRQIYTYSRIYSLTL